MRLGEISSHLNCHVSVLLLRSCAFWCRTTGFHQEASRCIPFPKLESYHRGKKTRSPDHHVTSYKLPAVAFSSFCSWQKTWNRICIYIYMYLEKIPCYTSPEYKKSSQVLRFWKIWDFVCKILCKSNNKKDVHVRISSAPPTKKQRKTVSLSIHPSINQSNIRLDTSGLPKR